MAKKKTARKKTTRKKTAKRSTTRAATKPAPRIPGSASTRTKSEIYTILAEHNELTKRQVADVFDTLNAIVAADLKKGTPVNIPGMMKLTVKKKPATKARKGINPFTGEPTVFKAKPASKQVKIRPLKALKDMV